MLLAIGAVVTYAQERCEDHGFGTSARPFRGKAWELPAGVTLTSGAIHEYSYCSGAASAAFDKKQLRGVPGGAFNVCFEITNTNAQAVTVNFPNDLLIQSTNTNFSNGLLMGIGQVTLAAGEVKKIYASAFCLNEKRAVPCAYDYENKLLSFRFGPGEVPAAVRVVSNIARSKGISCGQVTDAAGRAVDYSKLKQVVCIQEAIWEITSACGLKPATKDKLNAIAAL